MPQLTLKHCCIADVLPNPEGKENGQNKIVKINVDEEDFFDMLDNVNPKNILKYLTMVAENKRTNHKIKTNAKQNSK